MPQKFVAIAWNTFIETIRQPIFSILVWVAIFWVAIVSPALASFTLTIGNDAKVMKDVGLATLLMYGLLTSVFSASGVITREIESQTVLTVVSKPVSRPVFLLAKYAGVIAATFVGFYLVSLAFFLAARHGVMETAGEEYDMPVWIFGVSAIVISLLAGGVGNYFYGWNFLATLTGWIVPLLSLAMGLVLCINPKWRFQPPWTDFGNLQLVYACVLILCAVLILAAFAVTLSTRFSQVLTLMLCVGMLWLGLTSDYYLGQHLAEGLHYRVLYLAVPNFQFFWVGNALTQEQTVPLTLLTHAAAYAGLYTLGVLALGIALFETREVG